MQTPQRPPRKTFESRLRDKLASTQPAYRGDIERVISAGGTSPRAVAAILQDHKQPPELRTTTSWLLARLAPKKAVLPLLAVAADTTNDSELRKQCCRDVGLLEDQRAVPILITLMQADADPGVREAAAWGLQSFSEMRGEITTPLLHTLRNRSEDPAVRGQAAETVSGLWYLAEDEDPAVVDELVAALEDPSAVVRFWAAFGLSRVGDERVYPALERLAASDDRVVPRWWSVKHEALSAIARNLQERSRLTEAEAVYRRVLADDLEEVPHLHVDMLEDLARVLRREGGKDSEADELERQAAAIQAKHGF